MFRRFGNKATIPDPKLKPNETTGKWDYTEPDWKNFKRVINGDGP